MRNNILCCLLASQALGFSGGSRVAEVSVRAGDTITQGRSIPEAFGVALVVGVVFGIYPATRASRLDPMEALRYE